MVRSDFFKNLPVITVRKEPFHMESLTQSHRFRLVVRSLVHPELQDHSERARLKVSELGLEVSTTRTMVNPKP